MEGAKFFEPQITPVLTIFSNQLIDFDDFLMVLGVFDAESICDITESIGSKYNSFSAYE